MKKLLLTSAVLALTAGVSLAADLPTRKAPAYLPPPPPPPMWTGFYAGLNIGGNVGTNSNVISSSYGPAAINYDTTYYMAQSGIGLSQSGTFGNTQSGVIGGGQIGYNFQFGSSFLIGFEADIQGAGIKGSSSGRGAAIDSALWEDTAIWPMTTTSVGGTSVNAGINWMGTVRGRLGYLVTPTLLIYGTGGLTYGGAYANVRSVAYASTSGAYLPPSPFAGAVDQIGTQAFFGGGNRSQTLVGWNVGGGLEWMFMPNWSLKAEAIYWNMGSMNVQTASFANAMSPDPNGWITNNLPNSAIFGSSRVNFQGIIARAGVNYHFNWGAAVPVVAKY